MVNLSLRCWFSEASFRRCFSKYISLEILQYSQENTCAGPCGSSFTENLQWVLLHFCGSKYFFFSWICYVLLTVAQLLRTTLKTRINLRSSYWNPSVKKNVFWNFADFTRKHQCWSLFLVELHADLQLY